MDILYTILGLFIFVGIANWLETRKERKVIPTRYEWLKVMGKEWKDERQIMEEYLLPKGIVHIGKFYPRFRIDMQTLGMEGITERRKSFITMWEYDLPIFQCRTIREEPSQADIPHEPCPVSFA